MNVYWKKNRQNSSIKGIVVGDTEFKVSGYADDTLCFLDGSVNSCRALFDDLGIFAKFSGLKPNISKTQAFWAGANADERPRFCEDLKWVKKLKVLGVYFANDEEQVLQDNFGDKLKQIETTVNGWKRRNLTMKGKIVVIKSLLLPKLTHLFTALPTPPVQYMNKLRQLLFSFIWGGKTDRIKRNSLYKACNEGGLAMIEIESYIAALKITWARRQLIADHMWTTLFENEIAKGDFLWNKNARFLTNFAKKIKNNFWKETIMAFAKLTSVISIDKRDIGRCSLWYSNETKFRDQELVQWKNAGLYNINDIVKETGRFLTFAEFKETFKVKAIPLDLMGLVQSLPKDLIVKQAEPIIHPYVSCILQSRRGAKHVYQQLINDKYRHSSNIWEQYWEKEFGHVDWVEVYESIYKGIQSVKLQMNNYKIMTKICVTNRLLFHIGISEHDRCPRCNNNRESIEHKYWECDQVRRFWEEVDEWLTRCSVVTGSVLNKKMVILGASECFLVNHVISIGKNMINRNSRLNMGELLARVDIDKKTEEIIARRKGNLENFLEKWAALRNY